MKKNYESPIMIAETYKVNAYCGACNTSLNGSLVTDDKNSYRDDRGNPWVPAGGFTYDDLKHTFPSNPSFTSEGLCGYGTQHADKTQSIWQCTCHPDDPWFLEWSHYYSIHNNGGSVFFLYKDAINKGQFDIVSQGGSYPTQNTDGSSDINVARVEYTTIMVVNS